MPEGQPTSETKMTIPPTYIGAVFETGRSRSLIHDWVSNKDIVPVLDVLKEKDREIWALDNIRVFSDGTLASPELSWKSVIDFWLAELKVAAVNSHLDRKNLLETEKNIKSMMAISSSARAMEASTGDVDAYVSFITQTSGGDLDKQDTWAEFLLHRDRGKIKTVLKNEMVSYFYEEILKDAKIFVQKDEEGEEKNWFIVNKKEALDSKLMDYLIDKNPFPDENSDDYKRFEIKIKDKKISLNRYIDEVLFEKLDREKWLVKGYDDESMWAAARLAADIFLVDKYTQWAFEIDKFGKTNYGDKFKLVTKPCPGWGGDPLISIIKPCFVPEVIKGVYKGAEGIVLKKINEAFRPEDILGEECLPCSLTIDLKKLARYNKALFLFLGGSRANDIPQWTKESLGNLSKTIELLDQVYGGTGDDKKHLMGLIVSRLLNCKAFATAYESARPNFGEKMAILFGDIKTGRPFFEIEQFIWGYDLKARSGFLASLAGPRTGFIFEHNKFGADNILKETKEILSTNDQNQAGRAGIKALNKLGYLMDIIQAYGSKQK